MAQELQRKINILEIHSSLGYAGGQRNMVTFARSVSKDLFNSYVAGYSEGGVYEKILKDNSIEFVVGGGNAQVVLDFIKEKNIDVIHIHRSGHSEATETAIIKGAKKINKDIVIIEKNVFGKYDAECFDDISCSFFQSMMHIHERFIPESEKKYNFERMKVLYNMVFVDEFKEFELTKEEIEKEKEKLGISVSDFVTGKIARPHIGKWSDLILEMFPLLLKIHPNTKFIIIGVPPSRIKRIQKKWWGKNIIILPDTGDQKKIHTFYQIIDVLAHSSKIGECNGNTINEAMYWKKPVVMNSTPHRDNGQLEQIDHMNDGIIANFPETYARALAYLASNKGVKSSMGERGHEKILKICSVTDIVGQLEKCIGNELTKKNIPGAAEVATFCAGFEYSPSKNEIELYKEEYKNRLLWDFGKRSFYEKVVELLRAPRRLYWKVKDYLIYI